MRDAEDIESFFESAADQHGAVLVATIPAGSLIGFAVGGAGDWTVHNDRGTLRVLPGLEDPLDCRLECSVDDFDALVHGRLNAREAFLRGRIQVEGDIGLIQRLNKAFARRRA